MAAEIAGAASAVTGIDIAAYGGSAVGVFMLIREAYRTFRQDSRSTEREKKEDGQRDELIKQYQEMAQRHAEDAKEQARRADQFAEERNRAIEELGRLRGVVVQLTGQIEALDAKVRHLTQTIDLMNRLCTVTPHPHAPSELAIVDGETKKPEGEKP